MNASDSFVDAHWPLADARISEPDADPASIPESVIQDIWDRQLFDRRPLYSTAGERIQVLSPGRLNSGHGPDFLSARVSIEGTVWCGAVEIHRSSSDWWTHGHNADSNYDAVILHVTLVADVSTGRLARSDGSLIPELVLYPLLTSPLRHLLYDFYIRKKRGLACSASWPRLDDRLKSAVVLRHGRLRIEQRAIRLGSRPDPEQALYERLFRALGYVPNADAMEALARQVPIDDARSIVVSGRCLRDALLEAAGLEQVSTRPASGLRSDPLLLPHWNELDLRPANRPRFRIAQGAALFEPGGLLESAPFARLLEAAGSDNPLRALRKILRGPPRLARAAHGSRIGSQRVDVLLVDVVLPLLLHLARRNGVPELEGVVWYCLRQMRPQSDAVTRIFKALGSRPRNALETQGIHHLYRTRCMRARCLDCPVALHLLGGNGG